MAHTPDAIETPPIGFGTYGLTDPAAAVAGALDAGYRVVDTAASYGNEEAVGEGVTRSRVPREEVALTSKLRGSDQERGARRGLEDSLHRLGEDYLDLYLIHWPLPALGKYLDAYEQLIRAREDGLIRRLGVSNFLPEHITAVHERFGEYPDTNQIEVHPYYPQLADVAWMQARNITVQSYAPLGRKTELLADERVARIAQAHAATTAQVVLAWHVARGLVAIPKTNSAERAKENLAAARIELSDDEIGTLNAMERGKVFGDPASHVEM